METRALAVKSLLFPLVILLLCCASPALAQKSQLPLAVESAGNNLSFPVIWAEGVSKTLSGTPGMEPILNGVWWYQWGTNGTDPDVTPASCLPDPDEDDPGLNPDNEPFCDDHMAASLTRMAGTPAADNPQPLVKAYIQKDLNNVWQADSLTMLNAGSDPVNVDWIDWGDNLESVDWYTNSQVRTEVVLFKDLPAVMLEYEMRHVAGWGIDEVHGLSVERGSGAANLGPGIRATVYSPCARLTMQKLLLLRDNPALADLVWLPGQGWTEPEGSTVSLINTPIFNKAVHEGGDGPGYYSAEINVKGRVIFGYTWNVRNLNDNAETELYPGQLTPAGDYRITFSFDETCGTTTLNTYFVAGITEIMLPLELEEAAALLALDTASTDTEGGATAGLDPERNLTYIDVRILERIKGGKGGGK